MATFVCQSLGLALIFAVQVVLARLLGADNYGVFVYVTAWVGVLGIVVRCGLDTAVLRDTGVYAARSDWSSFRSLLRLASRGVLLTGIVVAAACAFGVIVLTPTNDQLLRSTFWVGVFMLPISAFASVRQSALLSLKRPWTALAPEYIVRPLLLGSLVVALGVLRIEVSAPMAMVASLVAVVFAALIGQLALDAAVPKMPLAKFGAERFRSLTSSARTLLWFNGSSQLLYQIDTLVIGALVSPTAAGTYYVAKQISLIAGMGLIALQLTAAPRIAALSAHGEIALLQQELSRIALQGLLFALVCAAGLFLFGHWVLRLFGRDFLDAFPAVMLLVAAQVIGAAGGAAGQLAAMSGSQVVAGVVYLGAAILTVILAALMVPAYGVVGVASVVVVVAVFWVTLLNIILWQRARVLPAVVSYWLKWPASTVTPRH